MLNASGCKTRITVLLPLFLGPFKRQIGIGGKHGVEVSPNRPQRQQAALDVGAEIDISLEQIMDGIETPAPGWIVSPSR